jgi:hypothetical protein
MPTLASKSSLLAALLCAFLPLLCAEAEEGQGIRGKDFEGVIFTPKMILKDSDTVVFNSLTDPGGLWTPSRDLVLKAEGALPGAVSEKTKFLKPTRGLNYPTYFSSKNGTNLKFSDAPASPSTYDSEIKNNFLYDAAPFIHEQKRQYIGVTVKGKKLLLISFIYLGGPNVAPSLKWKHRWVEVLDGGAAFWRVYYDPATGQFSNWDCDGYG